MAGLELIGDLLAAIDQANTARAMVKAIAEGLARHVRVTRVALGTPEPVAIAEVLGDGWRTLDTGAGAKQIVPGLAFDAFGPLPAYFRDPAFTAALTRAISVALHHLDVVHRVARLSRTANAQRRELRDSLARLDEPPTIVARSATMRDVLARTSLVAPHATTVLLTGESGTGKEVLAREIHRLSPRARLPLVVLNCGAIPESLIESELFGYERGAFTGADRTHAGVFERAHRGTLVLDEIGELSLAAQTKLLRVIQERKIRRVGGSDMIEVDARLIAATHRSLPAMVRAGAFREDLMYRIQVFTLALPPLRERHDDLGALVNALVHELCARLSFSPPVIPRTVMARLEAHRWPGNVRELANVLETALILGGGRKLELPDTFASALSSETSFAASVRHTIEATLRATRGKIYGRDGAAAQLGLKPQTLQSKMRKLGIQRTPFAR